MKKILFILLMVSTLLVQNANSQRYPSGSWVRQVTPRSMPQQRTQQYNQPTFIDPSSAILYEKYAYIDNNDQQTNYPELERVGPAYLKYFGQNGQYIATYEYPLRNLPIRYKYAGRTNSGNSIYYMASRDLLNGNEFINQQFYLIVYSDGAVGVGGDNIGMYYYKATSESKVQQRINERASSGYSSGSNNSGYSSGSYYDAGSTSSYSSGGGTTTTPKQSTPQRCPACRGTGTCLNCNGTGWYQVSHTSNNKARCGCGNGRCRSCHGTGHR